MIGNWRFCGRKRTAGRKSWSRTILDENGVLIDASPAPGRTYTRLTWPPRGRGRGESLTSPRRLSAKLRAHEVLQMRNAGYTWAQIAASLGFRDPSGPYRAYRRIMDRFDWDEAQRRRLAGD